jgi:hypothetical protein
MNIQLTRNGATIADSARSTRTVALIGLLAFGYGIWHIYSTAGDWRTAVLFTGFCAFCCWAIAFVPASTVKVDCQTQTIILDRASLFRASRRVIDFAAIRGVRAYESRWGGEGTPTWFTRLELASGGREKLSVVGQSGENARACAQVIEKLLQPLSEAM